MNIEKVREIATQHDAAVIDGVWLDATTANAIVSVYDALGSYNQDRYGKKTVTQAADMAWQLLQKVGK